MKTDQTKPNITTRLMDIHGLNLCEETLRRFLNYSALLNIEHLGIKERIKIINLYEELAQLLTLLRIRHNLFTGEQPTAKHVSVE